MNNASEACPTSSGAFLRRDRVQVPRNRLDVSSTTSHAQSQNRRESRTAFSLSSKRGRKMKSPSSTWLSSPSRRRRSFCPTAPASIASPCWVGLAQRAIRPDLILFADTGSERDETYDYLPIIESWLAKTDFPEVTRVRYHVQHGRFGAYRSLTENCLDNGTLPSLAFGRKACSQKWKVEPQKQICR
jgi:hypothetical protein